jgi:MFS-type transporter involved in bile tolerance (Atg22 family)
MVKVNLNFKNPIFTIIAGAIIAFAWMFLPIFGYMGPLVGGFLATYFAKEKKIMYGIYVGIIITIILVISARLEYLGNIDPLFGLIIAFWIFLPAIIGSYLGKKAYKRYKQNTSKITI